VPLALFLPRPSLVSTGVSVKGFLKRFNSGVTAEGQKNNPLSAKCGSIPRNVYEVLIASRLEYQTTLR
jgi:hypothetical protein